MAIKKTAYSFAGKKCEALKSEGFESEKTLTGCISRMFGQPAWVAEFQFLGYEDEIAVLDACRPWYWNGQLHKCTLGNVDTTEWKEGIATLMAFKSIDKKAAAKILRESKVDHKIKGYPAYTTVSPTNVFDLLKKLNGIDD